MAPSKRKNVEETNIIRNQYENPDTSPKCKICSKTLLCPKKSNLKRHLKDIHPENFKELGLSTEDDKPTAMKLPRISIGMDSDFYNRACVKMVTSAGLPFAVFEKPGVADILHSVEEGLNSVRVNRNNISSKVEYTAGMFEQFVTSELKNKMVCLKLDSATRKGRGVLGVNCQFIQEKRIVIRTLGMITMDRKQTAENIKEELLKLLDRFDVMLWQIYSITVDNGANFVKAAMLIKQQQQSIMIKINYDLDLDETDTETELEDTDDSTTMETVEYDSEADDVDDGDEWEDAEDTSPVSERDLVATLEAVRCAAHTLQLAVYDTLKRCKLRPKLAFIKQVSAILRTKTYRQIFKLNKKPVPTLECETRWNSAYKMLQYYVDHEEFVKELLKSNSRVKISRKNWKFIHDFSEAFQPLAKATKRLQEHDMTMGDFFLAWKTCQLEVEEIDSSLSKEILVSLEKRQKNLFENPVFLAAVYMDPRINYAGSDFLSESQKKTALTHILSLWEKLKGKIEDTNNLQKSTETASDKPTSKIERILQQKHTRVDIQQKTIEQKLKDLALQCRVSADSSVLDFWEQKNDVEPQLYALAQVVLAAPCTQVSVERAFSALGLILTERRERLSEENLERILFVKLNDELFDIVKLDFSKC